MRFHERLGRAGPGMGDLLRAGRPGAHLRYGGLGEALPDGSGGARPPVLRGSLRVELDSRVASLGPRALDPLHGVRRWVARRPRIADTAGTLGARRGPRDRDLRPSVERLSLRVSHPRHTTPRPPRLRPRHAARGGPPLAGSPPPASVR